MPSIIAVDTEGRSLTDITANVQEALEGAALKNGLVHLFIQHTSASLLIQENADPDVRRDLIAHFDRLAPEGAGYAHSAEGPDDMPAHIKTALTATSLCVPVSEGRLMLGTWQGVYVFEHRRDGSRRRIIATCIEEA